MTCWLAATDGLERNALKPQEIVAGGNNMHGSKNGVDCQALPQIAIFIACAVPLFYAFFQSLFM